MTSGYHDSKFSGSQQSFSDRDGHLHCRTMEEKYGLPFCSSVQSCTGKLCMSTFLLFSVISAGPRFVEIQKPWQPRKRDVTTSPLYSTMGFSENVAVAKTSLQ